MAKININNNGIVVILLLIAVILSSVIFMNLMGMRGFRITGAASTGTGLTNLSVSSTFSIKMLRNVTDFGVAATPGSGLYYNITSNMTNTNPTGGVASFYNGTEGNVSAACDYGGGTPNCAAPFVIENDGNNNATCVQVQGGSTVAAFIGGTGPAFWAAERDNETAAGPSCGGTKASAWSQVNSTSPLTVCQQLHADDTIDSIRVHWKIDIPSDAPPTAKSNSITITALNAC